MREVKIDFDPNLELVAVVVGSFGFLVRPKTVLNGEAAVLERLKNCRFYNSQTVQDVTDEELIQGTSMLMNTSGILDWAQTKLQYQI